MYLTHGGTSVAHHRLVYPCRLPLGGRHQLHQDPTSIGLIPDTANEPRLLKPIEGERDGTAGQAGGLRQCTRGHGLVLVENVDATEVGPIESELVGDGVVEDVEGDLISAHGRSQRRIGGSAQGPIGNAPPLSGGLEHRVTGAPPVLVALSAAALAPHEPSPCSHWLVREHSFVALTPTYLSF